MRVQCDSGLKLAVTVKLLPFIFVITYNVTVNIRPGLINDSETDLCAGGNDGCSLRAPELEVKNGSIHTCTCSLEPQDSKDAAVISLDQKQNAAEIQNCEV